MHLPHPICYTTLVRNVGCLYTGYIVRNAGWYYLHLTPTYTYIHVPARIGQGVPLDCTLLHFVTRAIIVVACTSIIISLFALSTHVIHEL